MKSNANNDGIRLISTLPKSGTWYSHTFFWCYDQLLRHSDAYAQDGIRPDLEGALRNRTIIDESAHPDTLGIQKLYITHAICPGFYELQDAHHQQWQALQFPITGYNGGEWHLRGRGKWDLFNPARNPDIRIVYLYRNPLDHFVSYYRHVQHHIDPKQRSKALPDGTFTPLENLHDFVFAWNALSGFIKHYYSFKQMKLRFPDHILLMPYERLTTDPYHAFHSILSFFGAAPDEPAKQELFEVALSMCSKEALMVIESKLGVSLAGDQTDGDRHIRGGEIGKWKKHFSHSEIEAIEAALNLFDITLNDFTVSDDEPYTTPLPWLAGIDFAKKQQRQIEFLQQQLAVAGTGILTELTTIKSSRSWRITAPLRTANKILCYMVAQLRRYGP